MFTRNAFSVQSSGALLLICALAALMGCGAPNPNPGADRGEVGPAPDAAVADQVTPTEDRPTVLPDAGTTDVADAASDTVTPPSDATTDASDGSVTPPEDHTAPDSGPAMCAVAAPPRTPGMCAPRLPPGMPIMPFACQHTCMPTRLNAYRGTEQLGPIAIPCGDDTVYGVTYANLNEVLPPGTYPCVGYMCVRYTSPTEAVVALVWDSECRSAAVYSWTPGTDPTTTRGTRMMDMPRVTLDM